MLRRTALAFFALALLVGLGGQLLAGHPLSTALLTGVAAGALFAAFGVLVGGVFSRLL
ncbi:MAG: hypothetical protein HYY96_05930 [Candidatus Tectomicrobia bacterium]|nr:hypothetical protein [Candidatus Tectomicrobia bacterium]